MELRSILPAGTALCDGVCVNLDSDDDNCGTCGNKCNGQIGQACQVLVPNLALVMA